MSSPIQPGLLILEGNRFESLRDVVFEWVARHPLDPLEEEIVVVQSNGPAEWLKIHLAERDGICAAFRFELPGRFLWRVYRAVLGRNRVAAISGLEREPLTWRLMRLLPMLVERPGFSPVAKFLSDRDPVRRLQLARRVADLFDQYQVYRSDWLADWERGVAMLTTANGAKVPVPADQRWQPQLWQAIVAELGAVERASSRPHVHRAYLEAMAQTTVGNADLPRRVILFGASHLSTQSLDAFVALSKTTQVILAIPNPCRYHWADIIDGREALRQAPHRHPSKGAIDLAEVPFESMHLYTNPLLSAWGRQGRDFMRLLDAFDADAMRRRFELARVDHFDDAPGTTLLAQVQAAIRDLDAPNAPKPVVADADRSIVFHVAHGVQREVEILQDQLLAMLAEGGLRPRDVVVMVPDIEKFAPSIRAVFGQYERDDARYIPFDIADLRNRGSNPLVTGLEWLLRLPDQRIGLQEVHDLLQIPAVAARSGIDEDDLPGLFAWLAGAGARWGLHASHRASIGLGAAGEQNSWSFAIRRMLLGYAAGSSEAFADVEPYDEIGGLDAELVGKLVDLVERIERWWVQCADDATPEEWGARGRAMIGLFFEPVDERERLTVAATQNALSSWLASCELASFDGRVPLSVLREGWLEGLDGLEANRRFMTGGVTFCTLIPLRAVPFEVVCLLGMNDGDFPRTHRRNDFDLIGLPGLQRNGDRSRRDDDRYLMLEALLSARRTLYVSWCGRNARDNAAQPPSVLVAQLRDYLDAGWQGVDGAGVLEGRTVEHPLQPFGRRYFTGDGPITYAREWRAAHDAPATRVTSTAPNFESVDGTLTLQQLVRFLRNPVREFFRTRLDVQVSDDAEHIGDDEAFELDGLAQYDLRRRLVADPDAVVEQGVGDSLRRRVERLRREGSLPMFEWGSRIAEEAEATARPMIDRWHSIRDAFPHAIARQAIRFDAGDLAIDDWIDDLRSNGSETVRLLMTPSRVTGNEKAGVRGDRLLAVWVTMLAASALGRPSTTIVIGCDAVLTCAPLDRSTASALLADLVRAWFDGTTSIAPFVAKTALAAVGDPLARRAAASAYEGTNDARGDRDDFELSRLFADFDALAEDGAFEAHVRRLFEPFARWLAESVSIEKHETTTAAGVDA